MTSIEQEFISVVVCAFNEEKLLRACLQGLISQTYSSSNYEVLIIDDESTDQTFTVASDFIKTLDQNDPRIRLVCIQHGGLSIARNVGIQLSKGDLIAFIDGDAVPNTTWLEELAKSFSEGADYVGGRIDLFNTDSWVARFMQHTRHRQFFGPRLYSGQFVGCNMAFRKEVFDMAEGFQENFVSRGDESTLFMRIKDHFQYEPASQAVVLHDRPDTVMDHLRIEWKSATLSNLCQKASETKIHWKLPLLFLEQALMTLFPILLCLVWLIPGLLSYPLLISGLAVIRRLYLRPLNHAIAKGLLENYGFVRGTVGHIIFGFSFNILSFLGQIVSPFLHYNSRIIPPMTTPVTILKIVDSTIKEK